MAVQNWKKDEITGTKKALREAGGQELMDAVPDMRTNRQDGYAKSEKELKDIIRAVDYLTENRKMPLVLATAGQLQCNPKSLGSIEPGASMCELVSKVSAMENCMTNYMENNKKQLSNLEEELKKVANSRVPSISILL